MTIDSYRVIDRERIIQKGYGRDFAYGLPVERLDDYLDAPDAAPVPTLDELVADEPDRLDRLTAAIEDLAKLVAPEDAPDPDFDAAPDTPWQIVVTYSDGRQELLDKVAEFHLVDTRNNTWPTGLALADDDAQEATVGGWNVDGDFRQHDLRRLQPRSGW